MKQFISTVSLLLLGLVASAQSTVYFAANPDGSAVQINVDDCHVIVYGDSTSTTMPVTIGIATRVEIFKDMVVAYGPVYDFGRPGEPDLEYEMVVAIVCTSKKCKKGQDPAIACLTCADIRTWSPLEQP